MVISPSPGKPIQGLSSSEVIARRSQGLGNNVAFKSSRGAGQILRENLFTFFNLVLVILGILLVLFGSPIEGLITSGVLLINILIATSQEIRAKRKLDQIALLTRPVAVVIRDGEQQEIDPKDIVLDDLLCFGSGDQIVVDGIIVSQGRVDLDESLLSGESQLVAKYEGDEVLSGSFCVTGKGMYRAKRVGINSFANKLTIAARVYDRYYTPLQQDVNFIIRILLALVLYFGALILIENTLHDVPALQSVRETSVLFGLAPSSLFLMIVVAYAVGAVRISNKGALVQQANSVESLCNVDILCLDKTGTLTTNHLILDQVLHLEHESSGYSEEAIDQLLGDFCRSTSAVNRTTEAIHVARQGQDRGISDEIPFSSDRGWSALVFGQEDMPGTFILGAPEIISPRLITGADLGNTLEDWQSQGRRVLLFSYFPENVTLRDPADDPLMPDGLIPLCLLNFVDELRSEVRQTLQGFSKAGIRLKFISGDNPETVSALVRQAGFVERDQPLIAVSGLDLSDMEESQFHRVAEQATIFGRVTPRQKERLINSLLEQGHYVAMTGDGINDILALKRANLGIAMQSGTQATRNVADIVLLDDSFGVLPEAFMEGQRILNGMQDILRLYMSRILAMALLIAAIGFIGGGFPYSPRQNAIISVITLSIPGFFLAVWAKPGTDPYGSLIRKLAHFVIPAVLTLSLVSFSVFLVTLVMTDDMAYAQMSLSYVAITCGTLLLIFVEPPTQWWVGGDKLSGDWRPTFLAIGLLILFILFLLIPPLRDFYGLTLLRKPSHYLMIMLATIGWIFLTRFLWRTRLVDRYLNVSLKNDAG